MPEFFSEKAAWEEAERLAALNNTVFYLWRSSTGFAVDRKAPTAEMSVDYREIYPNKSWWKVTRTTLPPIDNSAYW